MRAVVPGIGSSGRRQIACPYLHSLAEGVAKLRLGVRGEPVPATGYSIGVSPLVRQKAQFPVPEGNMVEAVREVLARHAG